MQSDLASPAHRGSNTRCFNHATAILVGMISMAGTFVFGTQPAEASLQSGRRAHTLMPVPSQVDFHDGFLSIDTSFVVALAGYSEPRLEGAAVRVARRVTTQTGIPIALPTVVPRDQGTLLLETVGSGSAVQGPIEDESYVLDVSSSGAVLRAPTPYGTLRGIETFLQLIELGEQGFQVPNVHIEDRPRFPWRGLLIDAGRHWMPKDVIVRTIDAMAAVKLNVLHWHLTEDQGFRIESRKFPRLHEFGSDGNYYTQDEVTEIVAYARDRGIRIVPEFDMPGHTTSWFVGHPELASAHGPYEIEREWGIMDPTMDPTRDEVYAFLDEFIGEMATLFPDSYVHIGGDEVSGKQWDSSTTIAAYKSTHGFATNHDLQADFNRRLLALLVKHGKQMAGWDEIFHEDLPRDIVIQSWRGQESLAESARLGFFGILSNGYYLDFMLPAADHYRNDPLSGDAADLDRAAQERILGGEACMWSEFVTAENIDSRVWPRTAAIAERLWSPAAITDVDDMYRRLAVTSRRLEWLGLTHRSSYIEMLSRLVDYGPVEWLRVLDDVLAPVRYYARPATQPYTSRTPLNRLVDATRPESDTARVFNALVEEFLQDPAHEANSGRIGRFLESWERQWLELQTTLGRSQLTAEIVPLSQTLRDVAVIGQEAAGAIASGRQLPEREVTAHRARLEEASQPRAELMIMVLPGVGRLLDAAAGQPGHEY